MPSDESTQHKFTQASHTLLASLNMPSDKSTQHKFTQVSHMLVVSLCHDQ